jgi:dihydrodipicolinate synthase/N-acetylneuraminate lyase
MPEFRGIFPAIITPMTSDDNLNEAASQGVREYDIQGH